MRKKCTEQDSPFPSALICTYGTGSTGGCEIRGISQKSYGHNSLASVHRQIPVLIPLGLHNGNFDIIYGCLQYILALIDHRCALWIA